MPAEGSARALAGDHAPPGRDRSYPIPGRRNLAIVALQVASCAAVFAATAAVSSWWSVLLLAAAFGVAGNSVYAIVHEAEHGILHPNRKLNDALGVAMALLFPAPFHLLRQGHLGHHLRNRSDDEAFDLYFDDESRLWKSAQLYGVLTGGYWLTVVFSNVAVLVFPFLFRRKLFEFNRAAAEFMGTLNARYWRLIRIEALAAIALHGSIIWALGIPPLRYALVYFGFGFSWSAMQYVHHFGTERHVVGGTRNLRAWRVLDWLWLNHNWHRVHHERPTVPWIHLARLGGSEEGRPAFLLWQYLRMWRGPRHAKERVENRYAGRIIR